jgi:hypothetical protein
MLANHCAFRKSVAKRSRFQHNKLSSSGIYLMPPSPSYSVFLGMDEDYPKTLLELERRFCTEEACVEYLAALRWPGG